MDPYTEVFDAAEQARLRGDYEEAVRLYQDAADLAEQSSAVNLIALYHMWGVALINLGETEEAHKYLHSALVQAEATDSSKTCAAISRSKAQLYLTEGSTGRAATEINHSLSYLSASDLSHITERGASLSVKACIQLAQSRHGAALEDFGAAAMLLMRGDSRHYELENGLHFAESLANHSSAEQLENLNEYLERVGWLATRYGGKSHRARWQELIHRIRAMKALASPNSLRCRPHDP